MNQAAVKVYSFDVFDTALARIWARPSDLFTEVGRKLAQQGTIAIDGDAWAQARQQAEHRLLARATTIPTLEDIYQELSTHCFWTRTQAATAMQVEITVEEASVVPVPYIREQIKQLRARGAVIAFVSDMYLPTTTIQKMLEQAGLWQAGDRVYVSADMQVDKVSGGLFGKVLLDHQVAPHEMRHHGDNHAADIVGSNKMGVASEPVTHTALNRYEEKIVADESLPRRWASLAAGASRTTRLERPVNFPDDWQTIWDIGANVGGPLVFGFSWWCIHYALAHDIKRLYFLARDGYGAYQTTRILCAQWGIDLDCRYVYASRHAWFYPTLADPAMPDIERIATAFEPMTIRVACERAGIRPEDIAPTLIEHGFQPAIWEQVCPLSQLAQLQDVLRTTTVRQAIAVGASKAAHSTLTYLTQQGFMDDPRSWALVDDGWNGTMQLALRRLLTRAGQSAPHITGLYFALHSRGDTEGTMETFFSDPTSLPAKRELVGTMGRAIVTEMLTGGAPHSGTLGYQQDGEVVRPVFSAVFGEFEKHILPVYRQALTTYAEQLAPRLSYVDNTQEYWVKAISHLLQQFIEQPTIAEAESFGGAKLALDDLHRIVSQVAPLLEPVVKEVIVNGQQVELNANTWWEGSLVRSHLEPDQSKYSSATTNRLHVSSTTRYFRPTLWHNHLVRPRLIRRLNLRSHFLLPYQDNSFRIVFISDLFGHLTWADSWLLAAESFRVLAPGGVIRIAISDLEMVVRTYLDSLPVVQSGLESSWPLHAAALRRLYRIMRPRPGLRLPMSSRERLRYRHMPQGLYGRGNQRVVLDSQIAGVLLSGVGFVGLKKLIGVESYMRHWSTITPELTFEGKIVWPHRSYIEGIKPGAAK